MKIGFGWIGKIFNFIFNTIKTVTGKLGREAKYQSKDEHAKNKEKKDVLNTEIDVQRIIRANQRIAAAVTEIVSINTQIEAETKDLLPKVEAYIEHKDPHMVEGSQEEYTSILKLFVQIQTQWEHVLKDLEDHVAKKIKRALDKLSDLDKEVGYELKYMRKERKNISKDDPHLAQKMSIFSRKKTINSNIIILKNKEKKETQDIAQNLKTLGPKIKQFVEDGMELEKKSHIKPSKKAWDDFFSFLKELDAFIQRDEKLTLELEAFTKESWEREKEAEKALHETAHLLAKKSVLDREYDSFLIQEEVETQEGSANVPEYELAA
jgi:hypothetical protein